MPQPVKIEVRGDTVTVRSEEVGEISWKLPKSLERRFFMNEFGVAGVQGMKEAAALKEGMGRLLGAFVGMFTATANGNPQPEWQAIRELLQERAMQ